MSSVKRFLSALGLLVLTLAALPVTAAHAEELEPVRRVSCPSPAEVNALTDTFSGALLNRLVATPTTCQYWSPGGAPEGTPSFTFVFLDDAATPAEAEEDIRRGWPENYPYPFQPQPLPALGTGAFYWADASPQMVYWQFQPGVVARIFGLADDVNGIVRTARAFRPMMEVYTVPGERTVNGRDWRTTCENYSATVRCRTDIVATTVKRTTNGYQVVNDWTFNSLTYRWSPRSLWAGNPLGHDANWTATDGRSWRTECDTPATGTGACRSYVWATVVSAQGGSFRQYNTWVFNNQVLFSD